MTATLASDNIDTDRCPRCGVKLADPCGWQDINTAPRDNSLVGRRYLFGRWDDRRFDWIVSGFFDANGAPWHDGKRMNAFEVHMPTHFIGYDRWSMPTVAVPAGDRTT